MAKKKFYAIKRGYKPGIYTSWGEAEHQVKGFSGARYKGFSTKEEAVLWLEEGQESVSVKNKLSPQKKEVQKKAEKPVKKGEIIIYTDGGAIGNPGPGGYGALILTQEGEKEFSGGYRRTTNNRMELQGCIVALQNLSEKQGKIILYSDSSYVVNGMSKGWVKNWQRNGWRKADKQPVLNKDLWEELADLCVDLNIEFRWVKGHSGNEYNERCDRLAVASARGADLLIDHGYEQ